MIEQPGVEIRHRFQHSWVRRRSGRQTRASLGVPSNTEDKENVTKQADRPGPIQAQIAEIEDLLKNADVPGELFCLESLFPEQEPSIEALLAYKAQVDPDMMYYHEDMRQQDRKEF